MITIEAIQHEVAYHFGVKVAQLCGPLKVRKVARPRQVAMYLARSLTSLSYPDIGAAFNRNHSTVVAAVKAIERLWETRGDLAAHVDFIAARLEMAK